MRVTIDATSALLRSAGVKGYTWHWIRQLRRLEQGEEIRAFPFLDDLGPLDHDGSNLSFLRTAPRIALLHFVNLSGNPTLDWMLRGSTIFHASNQVHRAPRNVKLTATLHDLTALAMPQLHTAGNVKADTNFVDNIVRRAAGIIAVSENTRQDAIKHLNLSPDRIETIYNGVAEEYFDAPPAPRPRQYVLYVGTIEPRKNLDTLLDAWRGLPADLRQDFDLVIAGPAGWNSEATLTRIRSEAFYLGYVPERDLPGLTAAATVFVYPSLYEGFGFPVAQAMAARVPVVTSNTSCLPEIAAGAAALVDPRSPAEITAALARLLTSESERTRLATLARRRAEQFRWEECASRSLTFFRRIGGSSA
jgi:alpha-1,3-rhamnosyl/mannosyltransferase